MASKIDAGNKETTTERFFKALFNVDDEEAKKMMEETTKKRIERKNKALREAGKILESVGHPAVDKNMRTISFGKLNSAAYDFAKIYGLYQMVDTFNEAPFENDPESAEQLMAAYALTKLSTEDIVSHFAPYNVCKAEERVHRIEQCLMVASFAEKTTNKDDNIHVILKALKRGLDVGSDLFLNRFLEEMDRVLNHTEEAFGYRINHISSGQTVYIVHHNVDGEDGNLVYEELGRYDTLDEAKQNADGTDACIDEYDPNDWWAIVDPDGKQANGMLYPTKTRAVVFLLGILADKVPYWNAWEKIMDIRDNILNATDEKEEKEGDGENE